jgi:NADH:ubiquinone oxidoreductase subunit E
VNGERSSWRLPDHRIRLCRLESCQGEGGGELAKAIEERVGTRFDERMASGAISLESLECIGLCGMADAVSIDDEPVVGWDTVLRAVDELLP